MVINKYICFNYFVFMSLCDWYMALQIKWHLKVTHQETAGPQLVDCFRQS